MTTPEVSVVIVSYGTRDLTLAALESVRRAASRVALQAIVVDNASPDDSADAVRTRAPWALLVRSSQNRGFAAGANLGAGAAEGEWLLFLNSDAELLEESLPRLLEAGRSLSSPGAIGPRILGPERPERSVGHFFSLRRDLAQFMRLYRVFPGVAALEGIFLSRLPEDRRSVEWVTGACLLVRRDVFESIGGFDEAYFMYVEDMDLCYRLHRAGRTNLFVPESVVRHKLGASPRHAGYLLEGGISPEIFVRKFGIRYPWVLHRGRRMLGLGIRVAMLSASVALRRIRGRNDEGLVARRDLYRRTLVTLSRPRRGRS